MSHEVVVSTRIDKETKHKLRVAAAIEDKTISDFVADLIEEDLEARDLPI